MRTSQLTLQRKCACGQEAQHGDCAACRKKKESVKLQRKAVTGRPPDYAPPIVRDVLSSPGQPLNPQTRAFIEPRFGHDFSRVSLHVRKPADIEPKLTIGAPGDLYEQQADLLANQVMSVAEPVARRWERGELNGPATTQQTQRNPAIGSKLFGIPELNSPTPAARSNGPLSARERGFFEPRFGHDFSRVRIHADSRSAEMAAMLNAEAFTVGDNIYFGPEKFKPQFRESNQLLAHELAHVKQQSHAGPALQPKLKITGTPANVSRAIALLNSGLQMYRVSVDRVGQVSIVENFVELPPNPQQQALANRLTTVINDPKDVSMTVSSGSKTLGGSYATGDFDIADLEVYGLPGLIHEIEEQYQKQVNGQAFGTVMTGAHGEAIRAEAEVRGASRGADRVVSQTVNADGTLDAVIEIPNTFPDGTVKIMVLVIRRNNIISTTWR